MKGEEFLQVMNPDSNNKEPVAFFGSAMSYDLEILKNGFSWIQKGIEKHPNRLDMRFGQIYMFGQIKDYGSFAKEIIKAIHYSDKIKNKWLWSKGEKMDDGKAVFLGSIQDYQAQLYNTNEDALLRFMVDIAETVLKYYPDNVESYSNISIFQMVNKDFPKAITTLHKALDINPKDHIVILNLAHAYKENNDKSNAIKYYELAKNLGDEESRAYAKEQIKLLKKG